MSKNMPLTEVIRSEQIKEEIYDYTALDHHLSIWISDLAVLWTFLFKKSGRVLYVH
jgi:hypothetical protein